MSQPSPVRTLALTVLAMVAFAANSVIGREGLLGGDIGAGTFAFIRLISGAFVLVIICGPKRTYAGGDWASGAALFIYAAFFSFAYLAVDAGAGALILFAIVQIIMVGSGLFRGERLSPLQWSGLTLALGALAWWLSPGASAPPALGALTMAIAGVGWGIYSLRGLKGGDPVQRTAGNFARASLIGIVALSVTVFLAPETSPGWRGVSLAILSGGVTSGLGYVIWYAALPGLSATRAGVAQLTVPVLAAGGGIMLLGEPMTWRFVAAAGLILTGVALATFARRQLTQA